MYNGKFEREKPDTKQTLIRYLPILFIVLISAIIVLLGYWLCLVSIDAIKMMYEFFIENIDKFTLSSEVFLVLFVIGLLGAFVFILKKSYFGEWCANHFGYSEKEETERSTKAPKMVRKTANTASRKADETKKHNQDQNNGPESDVSLNEVVWINEEPSNRYGYKF